MKLSLRQKRRLSGGILIVGIVLLGVAVLFIDRIPKIPLWIGVVLMITAGLLMITALVLSYRWWKCPCCGMLLGNPHPNFCPYCGEKIDYDAK